MLGMRCGFRRWNDNLMKLIANSILGTKLRISFCAGLLLAAALSVRVWAQFTTARLNGTVVDASGLALVGVTIHVEQIGTGYSQSTTTGTSGEYLFPSLPVGVYRVTATMTGFKSYIQRGIELAVGQAVTVPIHMELGSIVQNITVTANASMVTTDSAALGQLIDQKEVVELPLSSRYVQQLVFLTPGASNVTANYCAANCEGGVFPSEQYAKVNGAGANGVSYQLDGADFNDTYINTNLPLPNPILILPQSRTLDSASGFLFSSGVSSLMHSTMSTSVCPATYRTVWASVRSVVRADRAPTVDRHLMELLNPGPWSSGSKRRSKPGLQCELSL